MRKVATVFASLLVFLTLFSMGVQTISSLTTLPVARQGLESFPTWGRWAVGAAALWMSVGGARKVLRSRHAQKAPESRAARSSRPHTLE